MMSLRPAKSKPNWTKYKPISQYKFKSLGHKNDEVSSIKSAISPSSVLLLFYMWKYKYDTFSSHIFIRKCILLWLVISPRSTFERPNKTGVKLHTCTHCLDWWTLPSWVFFPIFWCCFGIHRGMITLRNRANATWDSCRSSAVP